jgi:hypothetical protein
MPKEGSTTLVVAQLRYVGKVPRHVRVTARKPSRLPPSDLGLYAIYGRQRGRVAILTAYTILLRQKPAGARGSGLAQASVEGEEGADIHFAFLAQALAGEKVVRGETRDEEQTRILTQLMSKPRQTEPSPKLEDLLREGGVAPPKAFEDPGNLGKSLLDTGHYDDGHSFGWKKAGTEEAIGNWQRLSENNAPYEELIKQIEFDLSADLNGDGVVEKPKAIPPGTSIGTEVGPPVITRLP